MPAILTNASQVEAFSVGLFGSVPGSSTMAQITADIASNGGLTNTLNAYYLAQYKSTPVSTVAKNIGTEPQNKNNGTK
jgi:hypothetical protein